MYIAKPSGSVISKKHFKKINGITSSLTSLNLKRYTQPLNDTPKLRRQSAFSVTASSVTSITDSNSPDITIRAAKPYTRSAAEIDPFTVQSPKNNNRTRVETHDEADFATFKALFKKCRKAVNFSDEAEYQAIYLAQRASYDADAPPPCLKRASGCNTSRERMLRLSQSDSSNLLSTLLHSASDIAILKSATAAAHTASSLLSLATKARTPIPLGKITGTYKLFCPSYAAHHIDTYLKGQRTLSIFNSTDTTAPDVFAAKLHLPPRSMAYSLRAFVVPPHASFRMLTLHTAVEGYGVDVVFLGNGYLRVCMDLGLLLAGKSEVGGVLEFWGMLENAVAWEERDEVGDLERVGRGLFARYDGEA